MKYNKNIKNMITNFADLLSEEGLTDLAEKTGASDERIRKLPIYPFTLIIILGQSLGENLSLGSLVEMAISYELTQSISKEAISQQVYKRGYEYFKELFNHLLKTALALPYKSRKKVIRSFNKINILDSTVINIFSKMVNQYEGTNGQAALKLHVRFNLEKGLPEDTKMTNAKDSDNTNALYDDNNIGNNLYITDLAYEDFKKYFELVLREDHFVVRMKKHVNPLVIKDLTEKYPQFKNILWEWIRLINNKKDMDLLVKLSNGLELRLIRIWDQKENNYFIYLTSLTNVNEWSAKEIKDIYRLRWQIEILFRDLKRVLGTVKQIFRKDEGIKSQLYAALCYYVLVRIFMLIAAYQTNKELDYYSVKYCCSIIKTFFFLWYREKSDIFDLISKILSSIKEKGAKRSCKH